MNARLRLWDGRHIVGLTDNLAISYAKAFASTTKREEGILLVVLSDGLYIYVTPDGNGRYTIGRER